MKTNYNKHTKQIVRRSRFGTVAWVLDNPNESVPVELRPIVAEGLAN